MSVPTAQLIDTTTRDGNQSLWATRMTTDMILPVLPTLDRVGYHSIEFMSSVHMDVCVRFLKENPWDRIRAVRERVTKTPLRMLGMSQFFAISRVLPDDVMELLHRTCADAGIEHFWITASMNDVRTAEVSIRAVKELGQRAEGGVQFTLSPVHTDEYFVRVVDDFVALGVDAIVLKDASGLLRPERVATLVPAMVAAADGLPVYCHSHCVTGFGPVTNLEAVQAGVSAIWTSSTPLANGGSLPSDESMAKHLGWLGYDTGVDREALTEVAAYFADVARRWGLPVGQLHEYDPEFFHHQMPGGMLTNFEAQLSRLGLSDKLDAVLEEMPRVRAELGYPNVQTPYSQFIGTQSLLNVLYGRYEVVPDEIRRLVLGYWGRTPGLIDPDVLDRAGQGQEPVTERPGALVPPLLDTVRREQGPFSSDEDLLMAVLFMPDVVASMRAGGPAGPPASSVVDLVREVARSGVRSFSLVAR